MRIPAIQIIDRFKYFPYSNIVMQQQQKFKTNKQISIKSINRYILKIIIEKYTQAVPDVLFIKRCYPSGSRKGSLVSKNIIP
jgi:hypothetical protein